MSNSMFYNWREIDGYNAPITIVIGQRGLGKTFGKVFQSFEQFVERGFRFVYVVETLDDVKTLSQNKGERFFAGVKEYLETQTSNRMKKLYNALFESEIDEGETDLVSDAKEKVLGGTIKIGKETAGYLIALNSFGNLKRNNFIGIKNIIIDEFIPEQIDIRHLQAPRKVASVIQTIARRKDVKVYMLGNSIRLDDILLVRLKIDNMKPGEIRKIKDKHGLLLVAHYVDPKKYAKFTQEASKSVSGRLSTLLGEDSLEKNEFKGQIGEELLIPEKPKRSHLLFCLHGAVDSVRVNVSQDYSEYYILTDYGRNTKRRYCFNDKFVSNIIQYRPEWKDVLMQKFTSGQMKFESPVIFMLFKSLMNLDINV